MEPIDVTPAPEKEQLEKLWQEYLQKCCEVGQVRYQLDQLDGQRRSMEKQLEVTEAAVKSAAAKHRELQKTQVQKMAPPPVPEPQQQAASH